MMKDSRDSSKREVSTTSTPQFQCPMLKHSNYSLWAIQMQIILEENGLQEMIEPHEKTQEDNKKDKTAIAYIYQSLPEDQLLLIFIYKSAKAIWDALKKRHVGENRVQQAKKQTLKSEFEMLQMEEKESKDSFVTRLTGIINKAASVRLAYEDSTLEYRHFTNKCPSKKEEQSNLVGEDLEPTLLMATVEEAPESFINQEESRSTRQNQTLNNKELVEKTWMVV
nr:zinc finger, CCHC-type [Tanacetum cinerariifolium]